MRSEGASAETQDLLAIKATGKLASTSANKSDPSIAGATVSLVNTFLALAIDPHTRKPRIGAGFGGLSGPAIKPIALRMVYQAARAVNVPVIGMGGIASGEDAAEFLIAGASAVEVGTATFWDPAAPLRIARELGRFLAREGVAHVRDLVGTLTWPR
jgi:dihydroorotate dehydrogenase (NAD+) catalytic subunit